MVQKNKLKTCALAGMAACVLSLLLHLLLASYSTEDYVPRLDELHPVDKIRRYRKLWGSVSSLETLHPYANPRSTYPGCPSATRLAPVNAAGIGKVKVYALLPPICHSWKVPNKQNGFIYVKIYGGFDKIRSSICDVVAVSRLLNATLVIPEIQDSLRSKGISYKFKSFSYIYNEEQFIAALSNDVVVVKSLPNDLKEDRKKNKFPIFSLKQSASSSFYIREVLPKLQKSKVVGFVIANGGCLESILPPNMAEYQRLRCRVAFHALQFRPEIQALGNQLVERLRAYGRPYLAFHPGLVRERLAFHGCAELFQDVHAELIQYKRKQMIKRGIVHEKLRIDSAAQKRNGSCLLMPEEVGILLHAMGYPPNTIVYLAGAEIFGGQRVLIPLRAMFPNTVDRTSLCSKKELSYLLGPELPLPLNHPQPSPGKSNELFIEEWKNAGPRPRSLPPPPARPFYQHEKEGWYGWVADTDKEPDSLPENMMDQAHRLLWDALDYYVSVEADAFFPGFHNDGSGWPDFSSLVMGHRSYQMASGVTYRPDRKRITELLESTRGHLYHPKRNWTALVRDHLNRSLGIDGFIAEAQMSKPRSFLAHPLPECSCRASKPVDIPTVVKGSNGEALFGREDQCPAWMVRGLKMVLPKTTSGKDEGSEENEPPEDYSEAEGPESDDGTRTDANRPSEQDEEMDPDD